MNSEDKMIEKFSSLTEAVINAQTQNFLSEKELAEIIQKKELSEKYAVQVFNFFSDMPVPAVVKFAAKNGIDIEDIRDYYLRYVKNVYPNPALEEIFL